MGFRLEDGLAFLEGDRNFYAAAVLMENGTLVEIGGRNRKWRTQDDFHRDRGWRAGTVLKFFPAVLDSEGRPAPVHAFLRDKNL